MRSESHNLPIRLDLKSGAVYSLSSVVLHGWTFLFRDLDSSETREGPAVLTIAKNANRILVLFEGIPTGNDLKCAIRASGLSVEKLAKKSGLAPNTIRDWTKKNGFIFRGKPSDRLALIQVLHDCGVAFMPISAFQDQTKPFMSAYVMYCSQPACISERDIVIPHGTWDG